MERDKNSVDKIFNIIEDNNIKFIDFLFGDLLGTLHHFSTPVRSLTRECFEEGIPFDGSSIRAWQSIDKSDMVLKPDPNGHFIDPFREIPTLSIFSNVYDPRNGQRYEKDPRSILYNALEYLKSTGIGDIAFFGPEPEFFIFDSIRYTSRRNLSFYQIESSESPWSSDYEDEALGNKIPHKGGYFPVAPVDSLFDFRNEVVNHLEDMGLECEVHHHEVATAGQSEIGFKFSDAVNSADNVYRLKYAVKNTAFKYNKTATFMPKPIFEDNGSGMHIHFSMWKDNNNLFHGDEYSMLSKTALYAIGGILKHGRSIQAFTNPTANSFKRLIPGYEAPVKLAYSASNRSAAVRIPYTSNDKGRRIEFRCPDSSGSPYLAFAAMLMAAIDGIKNQIDPGNPMDKNIYDLPPEELENLVSTCNDQEESLSELENDLDWLKNGDVFTDSMINSYVEYKKEFEILPLKLRPNPYEFELYYNS